jgi:Co/Zn/Cd efflux system component
MTKLKAISGVKDVHDLHIWSISSQTVSLTCHILVISSHLIYLFYTNYYQFRRKIHNQF